VVTNSVSRALIANDDKEEKIRKNIVLIFY